MKRHSVSSLIFFLAFILLNISCEKISCSLSPELPWCASSLKEADKEYSLGNYEKAISLYQAYLADKPSEKKIPEVKNKISEAYYQLGERAFNNRSWQEAINFYSQSENPEAQNKISKCYFNLGEDFFAKGEYQKAIENYNKSQEPGIQDKIKLAQQALNPVPEPTVAPAPPKPSAPSELYAISIKVFSSKSDAQEMVSSLKSEGIPAYISGSDEKGWTVFAGKFSSRAKAESALEKLKGMGRAYRGASLIKLK